MKTEIHRLLILLLLLAGTQSLTAQEKLKFSVSEFGSDSFDTTAQDERYKRIDGSGSLYAIIKVTGDNPDENLSEYNFNFGNMNCIVENHDDQLWLYVQKNAKMVTISRSGYHPVRNYDLHTTIEAGRTYVMHLSAQGPVIRTQMVMFTVKPANSKAVVMIRKEAEDCQKEMFGIIDATGGVAKNLEFGTYTYEIMAENYHPTEGRFTLNDEAQTYHENVSLRPNGAYVTLVVNADAEIFVNNSQKGTRSWSGLLKSGTYQVECRQLNHKSSSQTITVVEGDNQTFSLNAPNPIVGTISVTSRPLGANIKIDGKDYGITPRNITNMLIGKHTLTLTRQGYNDERTNIEVKETQTTNVNIEMKSIPQEDKIKTNSKYERVVARTSENDGEVYEIVEQMPMFPGGTSAQMLWVNKNLKYPASAQANGVQGRVIVSFVVNKDGSISEPKVTKSIDPALDKEALRLVSSMPNWSPGKQKGKTVRVRYTLPITFRLL